MPRCVSSADMLKDSGATSLTGWWLRMRSTFLNAVRKITRVSPGPCRSVEGGHRAFSPISGHVYLTFRLG